MPKRKRKCSARVYKTFAETADTATTDNFRTTAADDRETSTRALSDIVPVLHALAETKSKKSQLRIYGLSNSTCTNSPFNLLAYIFSSLLSRTNNDK